MLRDHQELLFQCALCTFHNMYRRDLIWHLREHHRKDGYSDEYLIREFVHWPKDLRKVMCIKCSETEAHETAIWLAVDPNEVCLLTFDVVTTPLTKFTHDIPCTFTCDASILDLTYPINDDCLLLKSLSRCCLFNRIQSLFSSWVTYCFYTIRYYSPYSYAGQRYYSLYNLWSKLILTSDRYHAR